MNEDLHDELRDVIERDYDLAFDAHARAMYELRTSEQGRDAALVLSHRDVRREALLLHWCEARSAERLAGEEMERRAQTLEMLTMQPQADAR